MYKYQHLIAYLGIQNCNENINLVFGKLLY